MSLPTLINTNLKSAFRVLKDFKETTRLTSKKSAKFDFTTGQVTSQDDFKIVEIIKLKITRKRGEKKDYTEGKFLIRTGEVIDMTEYVTFSFGGNLWRVDEVIKGNADLFMIRALRVNGDG